MNSTEISFIAARLRAIGASSCLHPHTITSLFFKFSSPARLTDSGTDATREFRHSSAIGHKGWNRCHLQQVQNPQESKCLQVRVWGTNAALALTCHLPTPMLCYYAVVQATTVVFQARSAQQEELRGSTLHQISAALKDVCRFKSRVRVSCQKLLRQRQLRPCLAWFVSGQAAAWTSWRGKVFGEGQGAWLWHASWQGAASPVAGAGGRGRGGGPPEVA